MSLFVLGNLAGGMAATLAYLMVWLLPTPAFLFLVVLFFGLVFEGLPRATGRALSTQLRPLLFYGAGLGLSPPPQDSGALFLSRITTVIVASSRQLARFFVRSSSQIAQHRANGRESAA
jgi:hypothetical protein